MIFRSKCQRGLIWVLFSAIISSLFNPLIAKKASADGLMPVTSCVGLGTLQNGSFELDNNGDPGLPGSGNGFDGANWLAYNYSIGSTSLSVPILQILDVNGNQNESPGILGWNTTEGDGLIEIQREYVGSKIDYVTASSDESGNTTFTTDSPENTPLVGQGIYIVDGFGGSGYDSNKQYFVSSSNWDSESGAAPTFTVDGLETALSGQGSIKIIYSPSFDVSNRTGGSFIDFSTLRPFNGTYMAEINAESQGTLFQNIPTIYGTTIRWSLRHAARANRGTETMNVLIGPGAYSDSGEKIPATELADSGSPNGIPPSIPESFDPSSPYQGTSEGTSITRIATDTDGVPTPPTYIQDSGALSDDLVPEFNRAMGDATAWTLYRGTYVVPSGNQNKFTYFGFQSQNWGTVGNLLDDIQFTPVAGCPLAVVAPKNLTTSINPFTCIQDATCTGDSPALAPIPEAGAIRSVRIQSVSGFGDVTNVSAGGENIIYTPPAGSGTTTVTYVVSYIADGITSESASTIAFTTPTYSISFAAGSGPTSPTLPSTKTGISSGTSENITETATATGYTFTGWTATSGGVTVTNASPAIFTMPSSNVTLTAQWTPIHSPTPTPTPTPTPKPTPSSTPQTTIQLPQDPNKPVVIVEPKTPVKPGKKVKPKREISVAKTQAKTVIKIAPKPVEPQPTIAVGSSDIAVQGLVKGQRIRVKIVDLNGKSEIVTPKNDAELSSIVNKNPHSAVTIVITPTLDSSLKKGAQIAIDGAKKNQHVRVTVK